MVLEIVVALKFVLLLWEIVNEVVTVIVVTVIVAGVEVSGRSLNLQVRLEILMSY